MSVTRFGVSAEKVVATIEVPSSHHGSLRPERKYCSRLRLARLVRVSLEGNGGICRGLLSRRYGIPDPEETAAA